MAECGEKHGAAHPRNFTLSLETAELFFGAEGSEERNELETKKPLKYIQRLLQNTGFLSSSTAAELKGRQAMRASHVLRFPLKPRSRTWVTDSLFRCNHVAPAVFCRRLVN